MSQEIYDSFLSRRLTGITDGSLSVLHSDGRAERLPVDRWCAPGLTSMDRTMLDRAAGPVLDVGCGPGRLAAALTARGIEALGVDVSPVAVELTRAAGAEAFIGSVFDDLPEREWGSVLLADGNVGIGGNVNRLLRRTADLVCRDGVVIVELEASGLGDGTRERLRLVGADGRRGSAFSWARLGPIGLASVLTGTGLSIGELWSGLDDDGTPRSFSALIKAS